MINVRFAGKDRFTYRRVDSHDAMTLIVNAKMDTKRKFLYARRGSFGQPDLILRALGTSLEQCNKRLVLESFPFSPCPQDLRQ